MADKEPKNKNIEYVLLAEFDIDKGSTIRHQYPSPCPISENILADLMLPEGAHLRETDWTYFFLRDSEKETSNKKKRRMTKIDFWERNRQKLISMVDENVFNVQILEFSDSVSDWFIMHDVASARFVYSGKWTKCDAQIPEITLRITEIENASNVICAVGVNIDLQWTVLSESELFCSFYPAHGNAVGLKFEKFDDLKVCTDIVQQIIEPIERPKTMKIEIDQKNEKKEQSQSKEANNEQIVVLNLVRTQKDKSVKRGAVVKAIAIATKLQILDSFKPLLTLALDAYYRTESEQVLCDLFNTLNEVRFDDENANNEENESMNAIVNIKFHGINMRLSYPRSIGPDEITGVSVRGLFEKFHQNNGMSHIYNAIFTQRRVIFVGHNLSSDLIANMVLSACLLVSPSMEGTLQRAYPYACLTAMQFLQISGYIAGVTNPIFEQRHEWFDVLCNVATGQVTLSESYSNEIFKNEESTQKYKKTQSIDKILMHQIRNGLQLQNSVNGDDETFIRSMFDSYTDHIVKIALDIEVFENEQIKEHDLSVNEWRIKKWEITDSYLQTLQNMEKKNLSSPFGLKSKEMNFMIRTIQIKPLAADNARIFLAKIDHWLDSKEKVKYFIQSLNASLGHRILKYMFHSDNFIAGKALDIALKFDHFSKECDEANKLIKSLNFFYIVAFERLKLERDAGLRQKKELKRKLNSNDVYTGKIEYNNVGNVNNAMRIKKQSSLNGQ